MKSGMISMSDLTGVDQILL